MGFHSLLARVRRVLPLLAFAIVGLTAQRAEAWTQSPYTNSGKELYQVAYANGLWVAVGGVDASSSSFLVTSNDGINWTTQTVPAFTSFGVGLTGVAFTGSRWLVATDAGVVLWSDNGTTWNLSSPLTLPSGLTPDMTGVVAVGAAGGTYYASLLDYNTSSIHYLYTSADGVTWTQTPVVLQGANRLRYVNGRLWGLGYGAISYLISGDTWSEKTGVSGGALLNDIAYDGNGNYLVVGGGGVLLTSNNSGATWTQVSHNLGTGGWYGVSYRAGRFYAIYDSTAGNATIYSTPAPSSTPWTSSTWTLERDTGVANVNGFTSGLIATGPTRMVAAARTNIWWADAPASPPTVGSPTVWEDSTATGIVISYTAGEPVTHYKITGITGGFLYKSTGGSPLADGAFITAAEGAAGLSFLPLANAYTGDSASHTFGFNVQAAYDASGTGLSSATHSTVTVNPINDAPVWTAGSSPVVNEDSGAYSAAWASSISAGPYETGQTLTFTTTTNNNALFSAQPAIAANGNLTFTPAANAVGTANVTVTLTDNGGTAYGGSNTSAPQTFTITVAAVNDAPVGNFEIYHVNEDNTLTIAAPGVLANDSDAEGSALTATFVSGDISKVTLNADGSFTYTPAANYNGIDAFTYRASDGSLSSANVIVTLIVDAVNDAPVAAGDSYTTSEDTPLTVAAPGVLANDSDVEGGLSAVTVTPPAHGSLTLNADGSFTYTPAANYSGPDSFTYKANDGLLDSATVTVSLNVNPVNDAPVTGVDIYHVNKNNTLTIAAPGVLANDSDVEGSPLTATFSGGAASGSLTHNPDGSFTYTPAANFSGIDGFFYRASDGSLSSADAIITLIVDNVNNAPVANNDNYSVNEDSPLTIGAPGVLTNDTDVDAEPLSATIVTPPAHGSLTLNPGGSFTYTPAANYSGPDSFSYKANDGAADSAPATVSITVNPVADAPVATADAYSVNEDAALTIAAAVGVLANDSDGDAQPLTAVLVAAPTHGSLTLNADGSFTYTPAANYSGVDVFTYKATDGSLDSATVTVSLSVYSVNDAPSFTKGADVGVNQNSGAYSSAWATAISPGPADEATQTLTFYVSNNNSALFTTAGQPALAANGVLSFTPAPNTDGTATVTVMLHDNGGIANGGVDTSVQTFQIAVTAMHTVTPSAGANGSISPTAAQTIAHGSTTSFILTPATGYTATVGGSCGGTLTGTSYTTHPITADCSVSAQFIRNFTASDESGAALGDRTVPSGDSLTFRLTSGSGNFDVVDASNANGVRGTLIDNGDGSYRFVPPTSGAFAGDYLLTLTDTVSGWSEQVTVSVPLQVALSRTMLLALGERNHAEVMVTGAAPATAITLRVESGALSGVPTTDDTGMVAADDGPNGNPASGNVTAQPTAQGIAFTVVASAASYADGRAAAQVVPAVSYAGSLKSPVGSAVQGKAELRTSVGGFTTTLLDELNLPYEASTDAQGQFTLIGPADGLDYLLRFTAAGYAAKSVAASDCLAFSPCLVVLDYELTTATPELNPPGGTFSDRVEVTLTTTTADATLVYTLDGTLPSRSNGIAVASGTVVQLNNSKTLKVMAWKEGLNDSEVVSAEYTLGNTNQVGVSELLDMVNVNTTQESSGGGAMGWGVLLALGAMVFARRRVLRSRPGGTL